MSIRSCMQAANNLANALTVPPAGDGGCAQEPRAVMETRSVHRQLGLLMVRPIHDDPLDNSLKVDGVRRHHHLLLRHRRCAPRVVGCRTEASAREPVTDCFSDISTIGSFIRNQGQSASAPATMEAYSPRRQSFSSQVEVRPSWLAVCCSGGLVPSVVSEPPLLSAIPDACSSSSSWLPCRSSAPGHPVRASPRAAGLFQWL